MSGILQVSLLSGKLHSSFCQHLDTQPCVDFGAVAVFRRNQNNKKCVLENNHRIECVCLGEQVEDQEDSEVGKIWIGFG